VVAATKRSRVLLSLCVCGVEHLKIVLLQLRIVLLQYVAVFCSVLQCVAVFCSVLQCVAVRCSVLQEITL